MPVQSEATGQLAALPFSNIIGGPLNAAVEAQALAAKTSVDFIHDVAFDDNGDVKNVVFQYRKDSSIAYLTVPILTIVPVPYLRIDDMNISFKAKIEAETNSNIDSSREESRDINGNASAGWGPYKASMNASYSSKKDSASSRSSRYAVEYTMDVNLHAVQDDIPAGLGRVLNILEKSIESTTVIPGFETYLVIISYEDGTGSGESKVKVDVKNKSDGAAAENVTVKAIIGSANTQAALSVNTVKTDANGGAEFNIAGGESKEEVKFIATIDESNFDKPVTLKV